MARQRRVSTECHSDVMLEDLMNDAAFMASLARIPAPRPARLSSGGSGDEDLFEYLMKSFGESM